MKRDQEGEVQERSEKNEHYGRNAVGNHRPCTKEKGGQDFMLNERP